MMSLAIWYVDVILCYFRSSYDEVEMQKQLIFSLCLSKIFLGFLFEYENFESNNIVLSQS